MQITNFFFFFPQKTEINREEMMLGIEHLTPYLQIEDFKVQKEPYDKLWKTGVMFHSQYEKWMNGPLLEVNAEDVEEEVSIIRDLFHVYLNKCEFHFSRLHVNKINNFCFLLNNGQVPGMTKYTNRQLKA